MAMYKMRNGKRIKLTAQEEKEMQAQNAKGQQFTKDIIIPSRIDSIASDKILKLMPAYKQRNMIARSIELLNKRELGGSLTQKEQREQAAMQAAWDKVKAIRAYSNKLKADIASSDDPTSIDIENGWPS